MNVLALEKRRELETMFLHYLHILCPKIPYPKAEYRPFPGRRHKSDFIWPDRKMVVEVQGHCHRTRERFRSDVEKRNLYTMHGYRVLECTGEMLRENPEPFFKMLRELWERE